VRGNPHAAFEVAGAGNVAWSRWCDTRKRKGESTGNTNFDLKPARQSLRANMSETRVPPEFRVEGAREMSREVAERSCEDRGQYRR